MVEGEKIGPFGKLNHDGVFESVRAVVFSKFCAQTSSLDTHHGIELRVEVRRPAENLGGDLEFLNGCTRVFNGVFGQITEQFAKGFRAMKSMAGREPVNLLEKMLPFSHKGP